MVRYFLIVLVSVFALNGTAWAQRSVPVEVTNPTTNPAPAQVPRKSVALVMSVELESGKTSADTTFATTDDRRAFSIPAGQRLVIEYVSVAGRSFCPFDALPAVRIWAGEGRGTFAMAPIAPVELTPSAYRYQDGRPVGWIVRAGDNNIQASLDRIAADCAATFTFTLAGYLEAAIVP